ncbi:hypothetical protein HanPI659440_Chr08g0295071 [Helianthus annuus]|nr:hypothetical protein HanPI659440_Chr08g0295071 [Helianthus annuus]
MNSKKTYVAYQFTRVSPSYLPVFSNSKDSYRHQRRNRGKPEAEDNRERSGPGESPATGPHSCLPPIHRNEVVESRVSRLGFRSSFRQFPVTSGEVPAKISVPLGLDVIELELVKVDGGLHGHHLRQTTRVSFR